LGDADLTVTTEELSRMADVCLAAAWRWTEEELRRRYGEPRTGDGMSTGFAVIGMGKLGGDELNYSSDIDLVFVYGDDGDTSGGEEGSIAHGDYVPAGGRPPRGVVGRGGAGVGDGRGLRLPRGSAAAPGRTHGRGRAVARGVPRLSRGAGRALGAPGPDQGALLRGRSRGGHALLRSRASLRLPARGRSRDRGRGAGHEGADRQVAAGEGRAAPPRQAG